VIVEAPDMPFPVPLRYVSDLTRIGHELDWRPQIAIDNGLMAVF
jgi:dTDP-D-glucose 4,6-dehydratase